MSVRRRLFAWLYHALLSGLDSHDPMTRDVRVPLLAQAQGRVLEIGAGDGSNLPLYPDGVSVTLLEPNPYLIGYLPPKAQACCAVQAVGERLPFSAGQFDTVVSTHVLCSVKDQGQVLAEIRRVLRPGGVFLFIEHVAAPAHSITYRVQRVINPVWRTVGDGCHLTRDTGAVIHAAGFHTVKLESFRADYPAFVSPHIAGSAQV